MKDGFICTAAGTPKIKVADCRYNAEQIFTMMREAERQGVKLLVLPELCLTGYTDHPGGHEKPGCSHGHRSAGAEQMGQQAV